MGLLPSFASTRFRIPGEANALGIPQGIRAALGMACDLIVPNESQGNLACKFLGNALETLLSHWTST